MIRSCATMVNLRDPAAAIINAASSQLSQASPQTPSLVGVNLPTITQGSPALNTTDPTLASPASPTAVVTEAVTTPVVTAVKKEKKGFRMLVKKYGLPLSIYFWVLSDVIAFVITALLYFDVLGSGDMVTLLKRLGLDSWVNIEEKMTQSYALGPISLSGKLLANYAVGETIVTVLTPPILAFCIATLPALKRRMPVVNFSRFRKSTVTPSPIVPPTVG